MCDTAQNACPHHETGLLDWHNPTTWPGGVLPAANAAVTVPAASKVLISQSVNERLGLVTIPVGAQLIIGGAAGNLIDRLVRDEGLLRGAVVDFIELQWFPVFNVADAAINIGAVLLILAVLRESRRTDGGAAE